MKWTETPPVGTFPPQGDEIAYYLLDLYCVEDSVYGISVNHNRLSTEYSEFLFGIKQLVE